jgi:hypothetical protein
MHVDEIEQSLRDMASAQPPVASGRPAVRRRHRNVRTAQVAASITAVVALVAGVAMWRSSDTASSGLHVVTGPTDTLPVDPALARCFPTLAAQSEDAGGPIVGGSTLRGWPSATADLLVLTDSGALSVIRDGQVAEWGSGYLWARWGQDGSIYASRLEGSLVAIDRLTGPGQATQVVRLPFTMNADAPAGYCAMDGYQADFSIGPEGMVLFRHAAGPVQHSCPAVPPATGSPTTTVDPWRCASREAIEWEVRTGDFTSQGQDLGGGGSGATPLAPVQLLADSANARNFAEASGRVVVSAGKLPPFCCGSAPAGDVLAEGPYGGQWATATGRELSIVGPGLTPPDPVPHLLWTSPDPITSMAWSGTDLAVVHGDTLSLVSSADGHAVDVATLTGPVRDVDWSR